MGGGGAMDMKELKENDQKMQTQNIQDHQVSNAYTLGGEKGIYLVPVS